MNFARTVGLIFLVLVVFAWGASRVFGEDTTNQQCADGEDMARLVVKYGAIPLPGYFTPNYATQTEQGEVKRTLVFLRPDDHRHKGCFYVFENASLLLERSWMAGDR